MKPWDAAVELQTYSWQYKQLTLKQIFPKLSDEDRAVVRRVPAFIRAANLYGAAVMDIQMGPDHLGAKAVEKAADLETRREAEVVARWPEFSRYSRNAAETRGMTMSR